MKQEALIKIKGIQRAGGDDDVVELLTTGSFARMERRRGRSKRYSSEKSSERFCSFFSIWMARSCFW